MTSPQMMRLWAAWLQLDEAIGAAQMRLLESQDRVGAERLLQQVSATARSLDALGRSDRRRFQAAVEVRA